MDIGKISDAQFSPSFRSAVKISAGLGLTAAISLGAAFVLRRRGFSQTQVLLSSAGIGGIGTVLVAMTTLYPRNKSALDEKLKLETLDFALNLLGKQSNLQPFFFETGFGKESYQPIDNRIALLSTIYLEKEGNLKQLLLEKNSDWKNQEIIAAADECMKISYAIGVLTLEDLEAFIKEHPVSRNAPTTINDSKRTLAVALADQDSYQMFTFYYCAYLYYSIRQFEEWRDEKPIGNFFSREEGVPEGYADLFYKNDAMQNRWNRLYNDYCDRIRLFVPEKDLVRADKRLSSNTQKDILGR